MNKPHTLGACTEYVAALYGDLPALSMLVNYRTVTLSYADLNVQSNALAALLVRYGIGPGDTVLMNAPSSPYASLVLFATARIGAVFVPLTTQSTPEMVRSIAQASSAKLYVRDSRSRGIADLALPELLIDLIPDLIATIDAGTEVFQSGDALAEIMYTSGTTGDPKGVMLTHQGLLTAAYEVARNVPMSPSDRILSVLPISHIYEQVVGLLAPLFSGAHIIYLHRPSALVPLLNDYQITKMAAVPEFLSILMHRIESAADAADARESLERLIRMNKHLPFWLRRITSRTVRKKLGGRLSLIASGGAPLSLELEERWGALGVHILQGYGLTEVSGVASMNTAARHKAGSVGVPLAPLSVTLGPDREILIEGPTVMKGYFGREDATSAVLDRHGHFHTGDIGEIDDEGFLFIRGRKKYMLKGPGGQNIYPEDIEAKFAQEAGVRDVCVIGLDEDERLTLVAVVSTDETSFDSEEVRERVNNTLASYQLVSRILVWPDHDFPRSATRKIKRDPVTEWARSTLAGGEREGPLHVASRVEALVATVTRTEGNSVTPEKKLAADLGLDSLMRIELVSRIELEFGVLVEETALNESTTVGELEQLVASAHPAAPRTPFIRWPISPWAHLLRMGAVQPFFFGLSALLARIEVHGCERLAGIEGPCLIMPNHISLIDSVMVARALPYRLKRKLTHAAGEDIDMFQKYGSWVWLVRLAMAVFELPRKEGYRIEDGLTKVGFMLDSGYSVCIFPEGHVGEEEGLLPLRPGAALLAREMRVPVIPVYIRNVGLVMRPRTTDLTFAWREPVTVCFGAPLYPKRTDDLETVRKDIALALGALRHEVLETNRAKSGAQRSSATRG